MKISAVLITQNEEKNLPDCLAGLHFCDELILVDSGSQDGTVSLARSLGAKVFSNPFLDFASQKNFGIRQAACDWVFLIDADERVSEALAAEIRAALEKPDAEGYFVRRINRLFGRWMHYGANGQDRQLRLVQKEKALFQGKVHERIYLNGATRCLKNPLMHHSTPTIKNYMRKLNVYTSLEADGLADRHADLSENKLKKRPLGLFFYLYFIRLGFLDGLEGFLFNGLSAYYEFVRYAKHWELASTNKGKGV